MPAIITKLQQIKNALAEGDEVGALRIAASFGRLGEYRDRIRRGWAAHTQPRNYAELGKDPAALVADGIAAIREKYGIREMVR